MMKFFVIIFFFFFLLVKSKTIERKKNIEYKRGNCPKNCYFLSRYIMCYFT